MVTVWPFRSNGTACAAAMEEEASIRQTAVNRFIFASSFGVRAFCIRRHTMQIRGQPALRLQPPDGGSAAQRPATAKNTRTHQRQKDSYRMFVSCVFSHFYKPAREGRNEGHNLRFRLLCRDYW